MVVLWTFLVLLGLIAGGMPIAFALSLVAIGLLALNDISLLVAVQRLYQGVNGFPLLAVPLFILAGSLMNHSGISRRLVDFARTIVGQLRGGLAAVNIVTSMFFAGMSGTSMSDTAAVGSMLIPQMVKRGYSRAFSAAVTASSSTIGIIIPPSVPMVLLAAFTGTSTGALFAAGLIPGLMLGVGLVLAAWLISRSRGYPVEAPFKLVPMLIAFWHALPALLMPVIILGGILGGIFTPTEAAAVACLYGYLIGALYYRTLTLSRTWAALKESALLTGAVMFVTSTAHVLGYTFTYKQFAQTLFEPIAAMGLSGFGLLLALSFVMILAGTFLDGIAMMFIIVPLFLPIAQSLGVDPIHFAMVVIVCWGIGQQTPPVGAALFITSLIAKADVLAITRANLWFIAVMVAVLGLVLVFPDTLVLSVPRAVGLY
jgi:TRAP-type transport system large permease protein